MSEAITDPATTSIDWATITSEIECPLCRYNLRGLSEPRCPECGLRFTWAEVLDPYSRHPYLFEHHPERNLWSFFRTLFSGLRARKFWTKLRPAHKVVPRRLVFYWALCSSFAVLALAAEVLRIGILVSASNANARSYFPIALRGRYNQAQIDAYLDKQFPLFPSQGFFRQLRSAAAGQQIFFTAGLNVTTILLWPWLTLAALMIFQASMKKAKVQRAHVLRCIIYSADASIWYLLLSVLAMLALLANGGWSFSRRTPEEWGMILVCALWLLRLDRLWTAYKKYLQFDHPFLTALASQIVVVLSGAALLFWGGRLVRWFITGTWSL